MHRLQRNVVGILLLSALLLTTWITPAPAHAGSMDYEIPNGHFYLQAAGSGAPVGSGFAIMDEGTDSRGQTISFWREFRRLGGVDTLGYPASRRFVLDGFVTQATQRVLMQWRPEVNGVYFVNVFDKLHDLGLDAQLQAKYQVPAQLDLNDTGKSFNQVVAERQAFLDANRAIRERYFSVSDPLQLNGLPTSRVTDANGVFDIIRAQRIVIQYWKKSIPGVANAGDVTVGLGGDISKEFGLVPGNAAQPESAPVLNTARPQKGQILFGMDWRISPINDGLEIISPKTTFRQGEAIRYVAYTSEPAQASALQVVIVQLNSIGAETEVSRIERQVRDSTFNIFSGGYISSFSTRVGAGTYKLRFMRGSTVLVEGSFSIQ